MGKKSFNNSKSFQEPLKDPLVETNKKWYKIKEEVGAKKISFKEKSPKDVEQLRSEAQKLLDLDTEVYWKSRLNSDRKSDFMWMKTVLVTGTLADKLAANTSLIQDSAIHNLSCIQNLLNMLNPKVKRECVQALSDVKEVFLAELLMEDGKLKKFEEQVRHLPDKDDERRKKLLILFMFEDKLLHYYKVYLDIVDHLAHSDFDAAKDKAVDVLYDLFISSPEQEQFLLEKFVNKLGDPCAKRASKVVRLLSKVLNEHHPAMKLIVANEVERFLYRPHINTKAQYYGLLFLNSIIFTDSDTELANKLVKLYFDFFKITLTKGKEMDQKMMKILLSGVSRSFPYSSLKSDALEVHLDTFYKTIHIVHFSVAIQILALMLNVLSMDKSGLMSDRYFCVLYRTLLECRLDSCSRKSSYLNVMYCALKKDSCLNRVKSFLKRLLQVALNSKSSVACGILMVVSEIMRLKPELSLLKGNSKPLADDEDEDDDEEEAYKDIRSSDDENENVKNKETGKSSTGASWIHNRNRSKEIRRDNYDRLHRNPLYANAEAEDFWELHTLQKHYHPSASLFARTVANSKFVEYSGDPLTDFTIKNFLERFVFRNPKRVKKDENNARQKRNVFSRTYFQKAYAPDVRSLPTIPEEKISLEDRFIHKYLINRIRRSPKDQSDDEDEDAESVTSEDFERLLEKYEPGFEKDFVENFKVNKRRSKNKPDGSDSQSSNEDSDSEFDDDEHDDGGGLKGEDDDEELNFDDDEEYNKAFADVDDDLKEAFDDDFEMPQKHKKRGLTKEMSSLFASADKFAELLDQHDNDSSGGEDDGDEEELGKEFDDGSENEDEDDFNDQGTSKSKLKKITRKTQKIKPMKGKRKRIGGKEKGTVKRRKNRK